MCGRFTLRAPDRIRFGVRYSDQLPLYTLSPRYNIAPTQDVLAITQFQNNRRLSSMRWGIIPSWSGGARGFINARAETLAQKLSFSESFERRRCLIPADGFYEWQRAHRTKQPHYFQMIDEAPFAFAGLWDRWRKDGVTMSSCTIITTTPNELLARLHDRMPVILSAEAAVRWLNERASTADLRKFLVPYPATAMKSFVVSPQINQARVDDANLVEPLEPIPETQMRMLF
jgi:putative SOS response-associated peptidase YedK